MISFPAVLILTGLRLAGMDQDHIFTDADDLIKTDCNPADRKQKCEERAECRRMTADEKGLNLAVRQGHVEIFNPSDNRAVLDIHNLFFLKLAEFHFSSPATSI